MFRKDDQLVRSPRRVMHGARNNAHSALGRDVGLPRRWFTPACIASPLAVAGGGAAVASRVAAVLGRSRAIVRGRLAPGSGYFGLIRVERVADCGADVALPGRLVAALGRAVSGVGVPISLIAVIGCGHGRERSDRVVGPSVSARGFAQSGHGHKHRVSSESWAAPAIAESVAQLRQAVGDFAYEHGVAEPGLSDIRLAVSEAVTNAVIHAFRGRARGTVIASVTMLDAGWVEVRVTDDGSGMAPRNDSPGMGLGLPLIRRLTDQFEHRRPPGSVGTELWMRFRLDGSGAEDAVDPASDADRH